MTFGENYFLIEAYATSMTDKLTIVKEFGCGASRLASVLCEHSSGGGSFCFFGGFFQIMSIWRCLSSIQLQAQKQGLKPNEAWNSFRQLEDARILISRSVTCSALFLWAGD